jgi:hypothetical protein
MMPSRARKEEPPNEKRMLRDALAYQAMKAERAIQERQNDLKDAWFAPMKCHAAISWPYPMFPFLWNSAISWEEPDPEVHLMRHGELMK